MDRKSAFYKFLLCGTVLWGLQGFSSSATGSSSFPFEECSSSNLRLNSIKNSSARQLIQETLSLITVRDSSGLDDLYYEPSWDVCSGLYTRITTKEATCLNIFKLYNQTSKELMALEGPVHIISMLDHAAWMLLTGWWGISTDPTPRDTLEELQTMSKELITRRLSYGLDQGIENFKNILKHSQKNSSNLAHLGVLQSYIESIVTISRLTTSNLSIKDRKKLYLAAQSSGISNVFYQQQNPIKQNTASTLASTKKLIEVEKKVIQKVSQRARNTNTELDVYINGFDTPVPTPRVTPLTSTFTTSRSTSVSRTQVRPVLVASSSTLVPPGSSAAIKFDPNSSKSKEGPLKPTVVSSASFLLSSFTPSPILPLQPLGAVSTSPSSSDASDDFVASPPPVITTTSLRTTAPADLLSSIRGYKKDSSTIAAASSPSLGASGSSVVSQPASAPVATEPKITVTRALLSGTPSGSVVPPQPVASPPLTIPRPPLSLLNAIKGFSKKPDGNSSSLEPVMMDPASNNSVSSPPPVITTTSLRTTAPSDLLSSIRAHKKDSSTIAAASSPSLGASGLPVVSQPPPPPPGPPPALSLSGVGTHTERRGSLLADLLAYKKDSLSTNGDSSSGSTANQNGVKPTDSKASSHQRKRSSKVDFEKLIAQGLNQMASGLNGDKDGKDGEEEEDDDDFKVQEARKVEDVKIPLDKPIAARSDVVEKAHKRFATTKSGEEEPLGLLDSIKAFSFKKKESQEGIIDVVRYKEGGILNPCQSSVGQTAKTILGVDIASDRLMQIQSFIKNKQYLLQMQEEEEEDDWNEGSLITVSRPVVFDDRAPSPQVELFLQIDEHNLYLTPFDFEDDSWPSDLDEDERECTTIINISKFKDELTKYEYLFSAKKEDLAKEKSSLSFDLKMSPDFYDERGRIKVSFFEQLTAVEEILLDWKTKGIYQFTNLEEFWDNSSFDDSESMEIMSIED